MLDVPERVMLNVPESAWSVLDFLKAYLCSYKQEGHAVASSVLERVPFVALFCLSVTESDWLSVPESVAR